LIVKLSKITRIAAALKEPQDRTHGIHRMLNDAIGATWLKDKKITCSDWNKPRLSLPQLKHAALHAWASEILGRKELGAQLASGTGQIDSPLLFSSSDIPRGLAVSLGKTLNEAQAYSDAAKGMFEVKVDNVTVDKDGDGKMSRIAMGSYKYKLRRLSWVEAHCAQKQVSEYQCKIIIFCAVTFFADSLPTGFYGKRGKGCWAPCRCEVERISYSFTSGSGHKSVC